MGEKVITVADETLKDGQKIKIADPKKHKDKNPQKMKKDDKPRQGGGPGEPPR